MRKVRKDFKVPLVLKVRKDFRVPLETLASPVPRDSKVRKDSKGSKVRKEFLVPLVPLDSKARRDIRVRKERRRLRHSRHGSSILLASMSLPTISPQEK